METNSSELENAVANRKSGPKVAQKVSKTHSDYWKPRLVKREGGKDLSARVQHAGRREWYNTRSANAAAAADKARTFYLSVVAKGWEDALAQHKPKPVVSAEIATVGQLIEAASKISSVRPAVMAMYASALRRLAGDLGDVKGSPTARWAHMRPEFAEHRAKLDGVSLRILTASAVAEWRTRKVAARKNPIEQEAARISCDSVIRSAASLFAEKLLPILSRELMLPQPLPFAGIAYGKSTRRWKSTVNPSWLFAQAQIELTEKAPEVFKAFSLCLIAGLRRAEADTLTWPQLDLEAGKLSICRTLYFEPKSEESTRDIDLPPLAVDLLRRFKADADPVFVLHGGKAKPGARYKHYRADVAPWRTWTRLMAWLAGKGVPDRKAVHALRKHAGSLIHAAYGLEVARVFLGHSDVNTTSASYLDKRASVTVNLVPVRDEVTAARMEANRA